MSSFIEQPRYSCALGAQQSVVAIKRAVPILHAGPGCSSKINSLIGQGEGYAGGNTIPCTNVGESEIVYGGEHRLKEVIEGSFRVIDADLYVVLTGCTSDIVGDDVGRVTADYQNLAGQLYLLKPAALKATIMLAMKKLLMQLLTSMSISSEAKELLKKGLSMSFQLFRIRILTGMVTFRN